MSHVDPDRRGRVGRRRGNHGRASRASAIGWFSLVAIVVLAGAASRADAPAGRLDRLAWLTGCWAMRDANRDAQLQWMRPLGGGMIGMSRTVVGGIMVSYGYLRIEDAGGQLRYVVRLAAQPEGALVVAELSDDAVVFDREVRDYPRRVRYARQPDGSLLVQVAGVVNGRPRIDDFPYDRAACDTPAADSTDREVAP